MDFSRILEPLKKRIQLLIGRAIVTLVASSGKTQRVQLAVMMNETITDVERLQEYGFESYPWSMQYDTTTKKFKGTDDNESAEPEAIVLFPNGDRSRAMVIKVSDRYYRPKTLSQGEVCMYTWENTKSGGHRIYLKDDQIIEIYGKNMNVVCSEDVTISCVNATVTCTGNLTATVTGDVDVTADGSADVTAAGGVNIDGGSGSVKGVVTADCVCHFTGSPHGAVSATVKASA
jgi:phage gp45-like